MGGRRLRLFVLCVVFSFGLGLTCFPFILQDVSRFRQAGVLNAFVSRESRVSEGALRDAVAYNRGLAGDLNRVVSGFGSFDESRVVGSVEDRRVYDGLLRVEGSDSFAQVSVPDAGVNLPVFHGTSDEVLLRGVGHLYGSSLPVGGADSNAVLTAHTGLAQAVMFDGLVNVKQGSSVFVRAGGRVLKYRVRFKRVVSPEEAVRFIRIVPGEDLVTLITCTPYSVNTHRLVVVAERVKDWSPGVESDRVMGVSYFPWLAVGLGFLVCFPLVLFLFWFGFVSRR